MDWDKLKVFHAAAEAGSFTHAGEQLGLSQSAVSRQVSALEQELGVSLFHRHARGLILTEQGEMLQHTAHDVFMKLEAARAIVDCLQVYKTEKTDLTNDPAAADFRARGADAILFASSSAAQSFVDQAAALAPGARVPETIIDPEAAIVIELPPPNVALPPTATFAEAFAPPELSTRSVPLPSALVSPV